MFERIEPVEIFDQFILFVFIDGNLHIHTPVPFTYSIGDYKVMSKAEVRVRHSAQLHFGRGRRVLLRWRVPPLRGNCWRNLHLMCSAK